MQRFAEGMTGKSGAVVFDGKVHAVVWDPHCGDGIAEQTANALAYLDDLLVRAGSGKDRLIHATVYLSDIADKDGMDAVWCTWIGGAQNWPQRACVGVDLSPGYLIEIVVMAALSETRGISVSRTA